MKILMVGCGAVGQVFGLLLQKVGVELGFYARPRSAEALRRSLDEGGLSLFQVSYRHRHPPITRKLETYRVVTDVEGGRRFAPDQIWFATPSPVYHSEWFRAFLLQVPSERVVCFAPEGGRPDLVAAVEREERLVFGGITFIAWQGGPEGGGGRAGGINFWLPPGLAIPLMGSEKACREVAEVMNATELRSQVKGPDYGKTQAAVTAVMSTFAAGVQLSGWSLAAFRRSPWRKHTAHAAQEAVLSQLDGGGLTKGALALGLSPVGLSLTTHVLPLLFPFDLETYLKFHYTKTNLQTLALLELFASDGSRQGLPVENIRRLRQALGGEG